MHAIVLSPTTSGVPPAPASPDGPPESTGAGDPLALLLLHPAQAARIMTTQPWPNKPIREESIVLLQIVYPRIRERMLQPRCSRWPWYLVSDP